MVSQLVQWVKRLFDKITGRATQQELSKSADYKKQYEDTSNTSFTDVFANSLANKAVNDCNMTVTDASDGKSKRSDFIANTLDVIWKGIKPIVSQSLGKGIKFFVPYVEGKRIFIYVLDGDRCDVTATSGDGRIVSATVDADCKEVNGTYYHRLVDYTLSENVLTIKTRIANANGNDEPMDIVPEWADITPEFSIGNVERVPIAFLRCPKDSRKENSFYGVPHYIRMWENDLRSA